MKIFFVLLDHKHTDPRDRYNLLLKIKLRSAASFVKANLYSYYKKSHAAIFAPHYANDKYYFDLNGVWRNYSNLLGEALQLPLIHLGEQYPYDSFVKKEFKGLAAVVHENVSSFQNIIIPIPPTCISECFSALKWHMHFDGPLAKETINSSDGNDLMNGYVLMCDTAFDAKPALKHYLDTTLLVDIEIPDYFFFNGFSSPTKEGKSTLEEAEKFLNLYVDGKRGIAATNWGEPTAKFGHMVNAAKKGMKGLAPYIHPIKKEVLQS